MTTELTFDVVQEADGGFVAEAVGEDIFTQGNTWYGNCPPSPPQPHFFHGFARAASGCDTLTSSPWSASRVAKDAS